MDLPLLDETDMEILMHRNTHFGGNFNEMIRYYEEDGIGINEEFELDRIRELQQVEHDLGEDLGEKVLPEHAKEKVHEAKEAYIKLRDIYDMDSPPPMGKLIADLILSEDEPPENEMKALVDEKEKGVASLIKLIQSESYYDPLFPGYGRAPIYAAQTLGKIKDEKAVAPIFSALGQENFEAESALISALHEFGEPAKAFLVQRLTQLPLSLDNTRASIALASFLPDPIIEEEALKLLQVTEVQQNKPFFNYLLILLSETKEKSVVDVLKVLAEKNELSQDLKDECLNLIKSLKQ